MIEPSDPEAVAVLKTSTAEVIDRWAKRVSTLLALGIARESAERIALQELQSENEISPVWEALDEPKVPGKTEGNC